MALVQDPYFQIVFNTAVTRIANDIDRAAVRTGQTFDEVRDFITNLAAHTCIITPTGLQTSPTRGSIIRFGLDVHL